LQHFTVAHAVYTNTPSKTAVRGPGELQAACIIETVIDQVAFATGRGPHQIRCLNMLPSTTEGSEHRAPCGDIMYEFSTHRMWGQLEKDARFVERLGEVRRFNGESTHTKRGIAMTPLKYHQSVGSRNAAVHVYKDGTILITGPGSEIGQGIFTKCVQAASRALSKSGCEVPISLIRHGDNNSEAHPNQEMTGGSTTSEACAAAITKACGVLLTRLEPAITSLKEGGKPFTWQDIARKGDESVNMSVESRFSPGTQGDALGDREEICGEYENYGAFCSEVELDTLTGECTILRSDVLYDCGKSLNPCIDLGQAEGAFMHGVGMLLREEMIYHADGEVFSEGTWEYKPPCTLDVPREFHVHFLENSEFKRGFLGSKASGEPPLVGVASVYAALRMAIHAARPAGSGFFQLDIPCTVDRIALACRGEATHESSIFHQPK